MGIYVFSFFQICFEYFLITSVQTEDWEPRADRNLVCFVCEEYEKEVRKDKCAGYSPLDYPSMRCLKTQAYNYDLVRLRAHNVVVNTTNCIKAELEDPKFGKKVFHSCSFTKVFDKNGNLVNFCQALKAQYKVNFCLTCNKDNCNRSTIHFFSFTWLWLCYQFLKIALNYYPTGPFY